jgi:endonuclease YncB( thermonuclease family)
MIEGLNVNREMVRSGLTWRYEKYSKDAALLDAQNKARLTIVAATSRCRHE